MIRIDDSSQPLELSPLFWALMALVALVGVTRWLREPQELQTLEYLESDRPVIIRSQAEARTFPSLGIRVAPPAGWTYLSVSDDVTADRLTFMNESTHSIVNLRRFNLLTWPPTGLQPETKQYRDFAIEWVEVDHRCVGRLTEANVDLAIFVITHLSEAQRSESIDQFCEAIRVLDET